MTSNFGRKGALISEDMLSISVNTAVKSHLQELSTPFSGVQCMGYWFHTV